MGYGKNLIISDFPHKQNIELLFMATPCMELCMNILKMKIFPNDMTAVVALNFMMLKRSIDLNFSLLEFFLDFILKNFPTYFPNFPPITIFSFNYENPANFLLNFTEYTKFYIVLRNGKVYDTQSAKLRTKTF